MVYLQILLIDLEASVNLEIHLLRYQILYVSASVSASSFCFSLSLLIAQFFYAINDMMNPLSNKLGCLFKSLALPQNLCALIPRFSSIALDFTT